MQCYAELTPPTAVTHSLSFPFISAQSSNLIVARASLLQIFTTKPVSAELDKAHNLQFNPPASRPDGAYDSRVNDDDGLESSFLGGDNALVRSDRSTFTKLVLVAEYPLAGTITGLAHIASRSDNPESGDALLLAFRDAKLSIVEWDPQKHTIATTSIHYYEQDDLQASPWAAPLSQYVNYLAADPGSRCAALKFGARNLAILQFKKSADEDIEMDDWDEELDGPRPAKELSTTLANGSSSIQETPFATSFVLRLPNLDPSLIHPVHLAFLHEYREPTFGILSSTTSPSPVLGRKDQLSFMVFTLDLQQKASTTILSVNGLPQDLFRVIALPAPVGGALLVGTNELIHVDQSGKSHGVGVNPFARQATSFGLVDQSDLNLKLEGCEIEIISVDSGELLMVLNDGRLAIITFRIDGRTIAGIHISLVSQEASGSLMPTCVATLTKLGKSCMFAGSENSDSFVIGWTRKQAQHGKRKPRLRDASLDFDMDEEDLEGLESDDDLYGEDSAPSAKQSNAADSNASKNGELFFRIHDQLTSIAPLRNFTLGPTCASNAEDEEKETQGGVTSGLSLICATGRGNAGSLSIINREIQPDIIGHFEFPEARGFWTVAAQKPIPKSLQGDKGPTAINGDYDLSTLNDKFMIVSKVDLDGYETSDVYALTGAGFEALAGTEFDPAAGFTIEAGTMGKHMRVIQVLKTAVHCYTGDFGLAQILPMMDDETGAEPRVLSASIADPFLLLVRDDASVLVAEMDNNLELEELEKPDAAISTTKWAAGSLYHDSTGIFSKTRTDKGAKSDETVMMFLLSKKGALHIYALPDLSQPVFVAEGFSFVPPLLSADFVARRGAAREGLTEIAVTDLRDMTSASPYLVARHDNDDVTIYEPFRVKSDDPDDLTQSLRFEKTTNPSIAKPPRDVESEDEEEKQKRAVPMRRCRVAGYQTIFVPGNSPRFLLKSSKSNPKVIGLQGDGVLGMSSFHTEGCERGFIYADFKGVARVCQLPTGDTTYTDIGMSLKKLALNGDVHSIAHHPLSSTYVVGLDIRTEFELPKEDDYHKEWLAEKDLTLKPVVASGALKLLNPNTWSIIDTVEMEACETIMCIETINLEISESTHERKHLVAVGTSIARGEDLPIRGRIFVYDVVNVIPEPGRPETDRKLKLVAKEDIPRGAVTALSEIGTQGLMLVAQGQKCMVRGLKEDGTLLPVAFMDMSCYVTTVRELKGTGLCLMADAVKGVWFTGYTEEPYKMILFGKSATTLEVLTVDFLPDGEELMIVACDSDGGIHILQFDPDHPKSLQGHLLLHRTTFSTGAHPPTRSRLLPRSLGPNSEYLDHHVNATAEALANNDSASANPDDPEGINNKNILSAQEQQLPPPTASILLLSSPTGVLSTLTPLTEPQYRRLTFLSSQLLSSLPQHASLNPKDYRSPPMGAGAAGALGAFGRFPPGVEDAGLGRNIVDGTVLARWADLGAARRAEIASRVGFGGGGGGAGAGAGASGGVGDESRQAVEQVREQLREVLGFEGLGYL